MICSRLYSRNLADDIAGDYQRALLDGAPATEALGAASDCVGQGMHALAGKLSSYDRTFSVWLAMDTYRRQGYTRYLFISEQGTGTCERCRAYHGQVFSDSKVPIPPLHPHCRCELLIMDARAEMLYSMNRRRFLEAFDRYRSGPEGGIFLLDHDFFPGGFSADSLTRLTLPNGLLIVDPNRLPGPAVGENYYENLAGATSEYFAGLVRDANALLEGFLREQEARGAKKREGFGVLLDWMTLGVVSGTWRGMVYRHEALVANPSFYNIANAVTMGALDTVRGALAPEEPWSLEHLLDILGTVLMTYAAYRTAKGVAKLLDKGDGGVSGAGLTRAEIQAIVDAPDGHRPDPSTYLSKDYIDGHLAEFRNGVTKIYPSAPTGTVGPPDGTFAIPSSVADDIIRRANGDVRLLEELLGYPPGALGEAPVRIDIPNPGGLRIPSGNELGVNQYWLPGGYTSGGLPEAIIDQVQPGEYMVGPAF